MDPTTKDPLVEPAGAGEFYDALADGYDAMTGFEQRFIKEKPYLRRLVDAQGIGTALDAGCGTGFHALALAQLGVRVTAVDVSAAMVARVREHARELGLDVRVIHAPFRDLHERTTGSFDAVFCLGNTIAHLLTVSDLQETFAVFGRLLRSGGTLYVQTLNYARILAARERVQHVREVGDDLYIRFYDFDTSHLRFNILRLRRSSGDWLQDLHSTLLHPWMVPDLDEAASTAGLTSGKAFGGISGGGFDSATSKDLLMSFTRSRTDLS